MKAGAQKAGSHYLRSAILHRKKVCLDKVFMLLMIIHKYL